MDNRQTLLARVRQYIAQHIPLTPQQLVLVGLSGGADSVALLSILTSLGYRCEACHCNFQLRGEESVRDQQFAREVAAEMGVPFREITFDTMSYASANKVSVEMACRELRYEWFEQQRREAGAAYVAVAHHRDDSIEILIDQINKFTGNLNTDFDPPFSSPAVLVSLSLSLSDHSRPHRLQARRLGGHRPHRRPHRRQARRLGRIAAAIHRRRIGRQARRLAGRRFQASFLSDRNRFSRI